jgi:hypothetical protein
MLATGKARPAAVRAMEAVGLAGAGGVVGLKHPGVFLQGLASYGVGGRLVASGELPPAVVRQVFEYAGGCSGAVLHASLFLHTCAGGRTRFGMGGLRVQETSSFLGVAALPTHTTPPPPPAELQGMSLCGFSGETCITMRMTPKIMELHTRWVWLRGQCMRVGVSRRGLSRMCPASPGTPRCSARCASAGVGARCWRGLRRVPRAAAPGSCAPPPSMPRVPRYYEPLAEVAPSVEAVLRAPPLRKLVFTAPPHVVEGQLKPHWQVRGGVAGRPARACPAVPGADLPSSWPGAELPSSPRFPH